MTISMHPHVRKALGVSDVYCIDFETYYDDDYSLRKMATTEYVCDPRFEAQTIAVQKSTWSKAKVFLPDEFRKWAKTVDWASVGVLGHHLQFDGLILSRYFGIVPGAYLDTLSMARPLMPVRVSRSLGALTEAFGRPPKRHAQALVNVKGKRLAQFTKQELAHLKQYNGDDTDDTLFVFGKLVESTPARELRLIDATIRMYAAPRLLLDKKMLLALEQSEIEHKQSLLTKLGVTKELLMSNDKFADLLRDAGVEPPMKVSPRTGQLTYAMSKQDTDFKALLEHEDETVALLVESRLGVKSTSVETRAARFAARADFGPTPVYLNYWGAKTGRWSGGDKANWQNLKRGSDLRKSIMAPPGHSLIIADLSQIEARINAWRSGQQDAVDAFASSVDTYKLVAAKLFNKPVDQITDDERFLGKCCVLALGYGAGWQRFAHMLRIGSLGKPINISDKDAQELVRTWRAANAFIVASWKHAANSMRSAFVGQQSIDFGVVTYAGRGKTGITQLPDGTYIRYDDVQLDDDGITYLAKARRKNDGTWSETRQRLYGGLIIENDTQALARAVIGEHADILLTELKSKQAQLVLSTHDEVVLVLPTRHATSALKATKSIMTTAPGWAKGLPLGVSAHVSRRYDK